MRSCVIFDFDGVIADTEEQHYKGYNEALGELEDVIGGPLFIEHEAYMTLYIPYGDAEGFFHMLEDNGRPTDPGLIDSLVEAKLRATSRLLSSVAEPLVGVRDAIAILDSLGVPRAICSSARSVEIMQVLRACELSMGFDVIVAMDDVTYSKPNPEGYALAFSRLNDRYGGTLNIESSMAIEDSLGGSSAALGAGLRVLGVATHLPIDEIGARTTWAAQTLADVTDAQWRAMLVVG